MFSGEAATYGRLLTATVNLLLAMHGEPEPAPNAKTEDVARTLDELASEIRQLGVQFQRIGTKPQVYLGPGLRRRSFQPSH